MAAAALPTKSRPASRSPGPEPVCAHYDAVEIAFHWTTAALVVTLYALAQAWSFLQRGTPLRLEMQAMHVSLGVCFAAVVTLRIVWRLGPGRRLPPAASALTEIASQLVHLALYAAMIAVVVLGFCFRWSQHVPLSLFGWFAVPSPLAFGDGAAALIGMLHYWVATIIIVLAFGHAAAALFHHYVLRDGVLRRMVPVATGSGRGNRTQTAALRSMRLRSRRNARPEPDRGRHVGGGSD